MSHNENARTPPPVRAPRPEDRREPVPVYVVWELTRACNLRCIHCGSRAGRPERGELTTAECLDVVRQLRDLGTREITLIGGEAYLRRDWLAIVRAIAEAGIRPGLQTGARALTEEKIRSAAAAGLRSAGVSVDGLAPVHDRLRGVPGSHAGALKALRLFRAHGLSGTANTQVNAENKGQLRAVMAELIEAGATGWQVQLTVPMGEAADRPELLLQPHDLLELIPLLADLFVEGERSGLRLVPGNNVGYFGPYEALWRSVTGEPEYYGGCNAGTLALGIEADGTVKGCPSLPTASYAGGTVRDAPLAEIWAARGAVAFRRDPAANAARLWGFCRGCYYASACSGGCTWTSHVIGGRAGNNPFCHHRVRALARDGFRERLVLRRKAEGRAFDHGVFDILVEGPDGRSWSQEAFYGDVPAPVRETSGLVLCGVCGEFHFADEEACPICRAAADASVRPGPSGESAAEAARRALREHGRRLAALRSAAERFGAGPAAAGPAGTGPEARP